MANRKSHLAYAAIILALGGGLYGCLFSLPGHARTEMPQHEPEKKLVGTGTAIFAAGDIARCKNNSPLKSGAEKTAVLIASQLALDQEAVVLTLGDNTYPVGLPAEFSDCYHPTWGRFKARTFPAPGNHDYYTLGAPGYYGYFGSAAGSSQRGYYSFTLGNWHVVSLNSNLEGKAQQDQLAWLKFTLAAYRMQRPKHCTLAYWHHPYYSSGGHGNNSRMKGAWDILQSAGADVILSGHDHDYERFAPQDSDARRNERHGMRQFVVGTGGAGLTGFGFSKPHSEVSDNSSLGVLKMRLKDNGYAWKFLTVSGKGFSDHGTTLCHNI